MPHATMLFAGLLTFFYLYLTWQVIKRRRLYRTPYGSPGEHPDLMRAIRAHGNFQEYTPLFLILLNLNETIGGSAWLCYLLGALFLSGRLAHAYSLLVYEARGMASGARMRVTFRFRFYAMAQTLTCLTVLAVLLLLQWGLRVLS